MSDTDLGSWIEGLRSDDTEALHGLARRIDRVDLYTYGHSERVCGYALSIGRAMELELGAYDRLRTAALLHDLGKVDVPREILTKPGRLTDEEFEAMKRHPGRASDLLARVPGLDRVARLVRHHHERFDGRGYPDGLAGEDIPWGSRILAVADAYDAMVSTRPYRRALAVEKAVAQIRECSGTQFDPIAAAAFVRTIRQRRALRAMQLGASTIFAELSIRDYEEAVMSFHQRHADASIGSLGDLLSMDFPELGAEQAEKVAAAVLMPERVQDDLYSDDVDQVKGDEFLVRFAARIDADVNSVVLFRGTLYCVLDIRERDDGLFEYLLKR